MGAAAGSWAGTVLVLVTLKTKGSQGLAACRTAPSAVSNVANSRPRGGRPPWALWRLHKWLRGVLGGGRNQACAVALSSMRGCPHWLRTACFRPWTQLLPLALNLSLKSVSHQGYRAVPRSLSRGPGRPSSPTPARPTVASLRPPHADPAQLPAPAFMSFKLGRGGDWSCPELVGAMGPEGGARKAEVARGSRQPPLTFKMPGARKQRDNRTDHLPPGPRRCALWGPRVAGGVGGESPLPPPRPGCWSRPSAQLRGPPRPHRSPEAHAKLRPTPPHPWASSLLCPRTWRWEHRFWVQTIALWRVRPTLGAFYLMSALFKPETSRTSPPQSRLETSKRWPWRNGPEHPLKL